MTAPTTQWLFGYGSLIWRPDFEFVRSEKATLTGFARRFWQGSHDHRGTPSDPGRVVTLVPQANAQCVGLAFEIDRQTAAKILDNLDYREKNGYERANFQVELAGGEHITALTYYATAGNHAYLGPASNLETIEQIARSVGPSGRNIDYLSELHHALLALDATDQHVADLYQLGVKHGLISPAAR